MIRSVARTAARWLPESARAVLSRRRFGYSTEGPSFDLQCTPQDRVLIYQIEPGLSLRIAPSAEEDMRFHFVENGDSRAEMASFLRVSRVAAPDALLLDVGAHKGLFSLVHLAAGSQHQAILLEPSASLAEEARGLLALNGFESRAEVRGWGAADRDEPRDIVTDALGFAREVPRGTPDASTVPFVTLDHLCDAAGAAPTIIKIDVEGAEAAVLRGSYRTLRRYKPVICLELHLDVLERAAEPVERLLQDLKAIGYRFETTGGRRFAPWEIKASLKAILRVVARCA
jgi:FkbM family methyltransferase